MLRTMQRLLRLVLDGVYRRTEGEPVFQQSRAPSRDELAGLLDKIIPRLMKMMTHLGLPACQPARVRPLPLFQAARYTRQKRFCNGATQ